MRDSGKLTNAKELIRFPESKAGSVRTMSYCVRSYFNVFSPALSFSWHKEQSRDVKVKMLTTGELFLFVASDLSPAMTTSGEMAAR